MPKLPKLKIIIEGPSKSGKTTVAAIINRFMQRCGYETILIDEGAPVDSLDVVENIENCLQPQAVEIITTVPPVRKSTPIKKKFDKFVKAAAEPVFETLTPIDETDEDVRF
jgi:septum formation inhibitor-activating ATPase MinD